MKVLTIEFISNGDYEDIEVTSEGIDELDILDAIAHALIQLRLQKHRRRKLERVK